MLPAGILSFSVGNAALLPALQPLTGSRFPVQGSGTLDPHNFPFVHSSGDEPSDARTLQDGSGSLRKIPVFFPLNDYNEKVRGIWSRSVRTASMPCRSCRLRASENLDISREDIIRSPMEMVPEGCLSHDPHGSGARENLEKEDSRLRGSGVSDAFQGPLTLFG